MTAYVFDTETTDRKEGEIIESCLLAFESETDLVGPTDRIVFPLRALDGVAHRWKPAKPITMGALAVHHILPMELEDCPPSSEFSLPPDCEYVVGHSVDFDWIAAGSPPGVKRICTHAMAQHVWPDATGYSLVALIYMLLRPTYQTRSLVQGAHGALTDCCLCVNLLNHIIAERPEIKTWSALWMFSEECRIPRTCPMKRYEGVPLDELEDGFIDWCLNQSWLDPYYRKGLERVIEKRYPPIQPPSPTVAVPPVREHDDDCACGECLDEIPF